jgi:hypothetical protein
VALGQLRQVGAEVDDAHVAGTQLRRALRDAAGVGEHDAGVRQAGAHRRGARARALGDREDVAAVHGDDRRHAGAGAPDRVARRGGVVGVDEVERELAPQAPQRERQRRRRPCAPGAVAARARRRDERDVADQQPVQLRAQRLAQRGGDRARLAAAERGLRRDGAVEHEHPDVRAGVASRERLAVRPDAEHRVGRARVVLGDDGDAHGHASRRVWSTAAACSLGSCRATTGRRMVTARPIRR